MVSCSSSSWQCVYEWWMVCGGPGMNVCLCRLNYVHTYTVVVVVVVRGGKQDTAAVAVVVL